MVKVRVMLVRLSPHLKIVAGFVLFAVAVFATSGALAQNVQRIAAVVNEEIVSVFDLESRIKLLIKTSGMTDDDETRRRLQPQIIRQLIDEKLQLQEANRLNAPVSEKEVDEAIGRIE